MSFHQQDKDKCSLRIVDRISTISISPAWWGTHTGKNEKSNSRFLTEIDE